jgi:transcriptional regulator with XRE-family HTH domain
MKYDPITEIKVAMVLCNETALTLSEKMAVSRSYVHAILNGRQPLENVSPKNLQLLCKLLKLNHLQMLINLGVLDENLVKKEVKTLA